MTGLDILLTIMSVFCFAAAFFIASKPIAKTKSNSTLWSEEPDDRKPSVEIYTSVSEETQ
jgi:hypothetical protein